MLAATAAQPALQYNPVLIANAVTVYVYSQPIGRQSQDSNIELKRLPTSPIIRQPLCLAATRTLRTNTKTQQRSPGLLEPCALVDHRSTQASSPLFKRMKRRSA
ncbi:hypothetical protein H9L39_11630 [Fusarium oxysporum f. sp. albedinis]|nr:hypothetical protein H9L39_11630 [Fusarium oxysporum f. sp. albedinis]